MAETLGIYDFSTQTGVAAGDATPVTDAFFNWGTIPKSSSDDLEFVVKNESDTYTANNVVISVGDVGDASVLLSPQILLSMDRHTFVKSLNLGNIPANAYTPPIVMKRVTRSDAVSGSYQVRVQAGTWT